MLDFAISCFGEMSIAENAKNTKNANNTEKESGDGRYCTESLCIALIPKFVNNGIVIAFAGQEVLFSLKSKEKPVKYYLMEVVKVHMKNFLRESILSLSSILKKLKFATHY